MMAMENAAILDFSLKTEYQNWSQNELLASCAVSTTDRVKC